MAAACSTFPALSPLPLSSSTTRTRVPICSFPRSTHFTTNLVYNTTQIPTRLRISQKIGVVPNHVFRVRILCCLGDNPSQVPSELAPDDLKEATVDLKLPRRSLLVHFTCNTCGERTQKLINRVAYERGTVFVQCAGCLQHHKLIDNLGLVVEYDFREESDMDSKADQV